MIGYSFIFIINIKEMKKPEKLSNKNDFLESARANKGHLKSK